MIMMNRKVALSGLVVSIFAVTGATAEDPAGGEPGKRKGSERGGDGGREFAQRFIKNADTDGDGAVSRAEFDSMERIGFLPENRRGEVFDRLDKNGDGKIEHDELKGGPPGGAGKFPAPRLRELDEDKDGAISFEEFLKSPFVGKMPEDRRRSLFDRMDRNKDGQLSPADRPEGGGRDKGPRHRRGEDGPRDLGALIDQLDANGDGALSFEEFRAAPWMVDAGEDVQEDRFEKFDRNGDLKIDASDAPAKE